MLVEFGLLNGQEKRWWLRRGSIRIAVAFGAGRMQCGQALDEGDQERTLETVALMAHVGAQAPIGNSHIDR